MKVGIVVPYSWSYWGAVLEHSELQAESLHRLGVATRTIIGNDPPGSFTRVLHPRHGRHGDPPAHVIPVGRSVIVPANASLPNIVLSPRAVPRIKRVLERERFDVLHLHEPMTPVICTAVMAWARCPVVATFHASGGLAWMHVGGRAWGFLMDRIDHRIAVSEAARETADRWMPGKAAGSTADLRYASERERSQGRRDPTNAKRPQKRDNRAGLRRAQMKAEHGHTPAVWTAVTIVLIGFVVGGVAVIVAQPWLAFVGIGIVVLGGIVGKIMQMMGLGKPQPAARH